MNQARSGHNAITTGPAPDSTVIIAGGLGEFQTEIWNFESNESKSVEPSLYYYAMYPGLFNVAADYCKLIST